MNKSARYVVKRWPGVACYFAGYPKVWEPDTCLATDAEGNEYEEETGEGEWVEDTESGTVLMVMVGDDYKHRVDEKDCVEIDEDAYCHVCGQVGCTHDGRDRG